MKELTIMITKNCNLSCNFCINDYKMQDKTRMVKDLDILLEDYLNAHGDIYNAFAISGGEPFIDRTKMENILSVLLSHSTDKPITINTNACYLDDDIISVINEYPNIHIKLGIDGILPRERSIFTGVSNTFKGSYNTLLSILKLKNKSISFVVTREMLKEHTLALEILSLVKLFDCRVNITLDSNSEVLNKIDLDDIYAISRLVYQLSKLGIYRKYVGFKYMFEQVCIGADIDIFNWDGTLASYCTHRSDNTGGGCGRYRDIMKDGVYDLLRKIINYDIRDNDVELDSLPLYFDLKEEVGDVTKRNYATSGIIPIKEVS